MKKSAVTTRPLLDGINAEKSAALCCELRQEFKCVNLKFETNFHFNAVLVHIYSDAVSKAGF